MDYFTVVKRHFDAGRYTVDQVKVFVRGKGITEEEFFIITGQEYVA